MVGLLVGWVLVGAAEIATGCMWACNGGGGGGTRAGTTHSRVL
jgi:hypothetical protein